MSPIVRKEAGGDRSARGLSLTLAILGWLAACFSAGAQATVATIGGGQRTNCSAITAGFVSGNTFQTAMFNGPWSCALDTNGNLWIADRTNSDIEEVTQAGNETSSQTIEFYTTTGSGPTIKTNSHFLTNVTAVAVDPANNLYVFVPSPPQVYQCNIGGQNSTLNVLASLVLTNAPANAATAMAVDAGSNVFLAFNTGVIVRFQMLDTHAPPTPTLYTNNYSNTTSYIVSNNFHWAPAGLALQANGTLAVSDTLSNAIYFIPTNTFAAGGGATANLPRLITGGTATGWQDGIPGFAEFDQPRGLAASGDGRLVVCDTMNNAVRVIDTASNTTSLYGTLSNEWQKADYCGSPAIFPGWLDGMASPKISNSASGRLPTSVAISTNGSLFVTEVYYSLIREVTGTTFSQVNLSATLPAAVTEPASGLTSSNASLNGTVYPGDVDTYYYFEWGLTTNYGNDTVTNLLTTSLTQTQPVAVTLSNLVPATSYHYQLVAYNGEGYSYGGDMVANTLATPPVVTTEPATSITGSSATLNAAVDPEGSVTSVYFQYGLTTNYGSTTGETNLATNLLSTVSVSNTINNLQANSLYYYQAVALNTGGTTYGNQYIFSTLLSPPPTLSISPASGYFPECTNITVFSSVSNVYYSTDGVAATTGSTPLAMVPNGSGFIGSILWCQPQENLSALYVLAGTGTNTTLVEGGYSAANYIGFPQILTAGPGASVYIPVVVELQSNATLKSLQFSAEVTPVSPNTNPITFIDLQPLTANDLVALPGPAPGNAPVTFDTFAIQNGLAIIATGTSGLDMTGSSVAVLLHVGIPAAATDGQSYSLTVLAPSGTSDGQQDYINLTPLPAQALNITNIPYMVGDSSPSAGYDAGQFGNKDTTNSIYEVGLYNADVNNAINASFGIHLPPSDSDIYDAMDAYPPDTAGSVGGDGLITMLDWETILRRSLGLDTNNWLRYHTNGGNLANAAFTNWMAGDPPTPLSLETSAGRPSRKLSLGNSPPGLVWLRQAAFSAGTKTNVAPGSVCSLPISVKVASGYSLSGMQFRAVLTADAGAPTPGAISFSPASGIPTPASVTGNGSSDMAYYWTLGTFPAGLQNSNYLGTISFQVPAGAQAGNGYELHFMGVDGAPNLQTFYQLESFPGRVWVSSVALQPTSLTSDEWKLAFFGSISNAQAADGVDADGDGMLNWQEYVAGTNPTNNQSKFEFTTASFVTNGLKGVGLGWLTAPGKTYILESIPALGGANWTAINTNVGDGYNYQFVQTNYGGNARFYQLRVQP